MASNKKHLPPSQKPKQAKPAAKEKIIQSIPWWVPAAIIAFTALLYSEALFNDFASWDDDSYILKNPYIRDFSFNAIKEIFSTFYFANYHPLTSVSYLIDYTCFGLNPMPYHLVNVIFHLLNVWLVFKLAEKLSKNKIVPVLVSLLFAIHPMHVESVAWISERKDVLYTFFYLISVLFYLRWIDNGKRVALWVVSFLFFLCSLLSKSAAVTLPVLLVAVDLYKGRKINIWFFLDKLPFLLLSLLFGILAIMSQQSTESINDLSVSYSFFERIFLFTYAVFFYLLKLILPFQLSAMHYFPETHGAPLPWYYFASLPLLLLLSWFVVRCSSFRKEILFGVSFFLITISVMLPVVPVGFALTAERYTYVAYLGLFFLTGQWIASIAGKQQRKLALIIASVFIIVFSFQTRNRIAVWKNGDTLFSDVIKKYPDIFHGYWIRGNVRNNAEDLKGALQDYNKALERRPNFAFGLVNRGDVRNKLFDYKGALQDLNLALKLDSSTAEAYNNRGMAFDGTGDTAASMKDYNKAIKLKPDLEKAYNNRGVLFANCGNTEKALKDLNKAVELAPDDGEAYTNRANVKAMRNDFKGALADYDVSLKLKPNDKTVYFNRGISRMNMKDSSGACKDWEKALQLGNEAASETLKRYCR